MAETRPALLVVDDVQDNLALARALLRQRYDVRTAPAVIRRWKWPTRNRRT
jgi:CheY-like chemotaxis protein